MSNPWIVDEADFYELETHEQQMEFLLRYAILAPSGHNAQPWSFRITPIGVEVRRDASRRLLIVDRDDREMLLSLGAAIANFRVAAAHFGFETTVAYEPRPQETLPAATILACETCAPNRELAERFPAILKRHTNRQPFDTTPLAPETLRPICDVVDANPGTLCMVLPRDTERVAECVELADKALMARPAYRAELADWIAASEERNDGLPAHALGVPRALSGIAPWLIRTFDSGGLRARHDAELTRNASMLLVVTADDDPTSLLKAGEILELLLLTITRIGLQYSFLSAPIEVEESRQNLRAMLGTTRTPQLLVRIGSTATPVTATPRRPVENAIE